MWEGVETVRAGMLKHGVTAFCPTIVTSDPEYYHRVLWASSKPPTGEEGCLFLSSFTYYKVHVCGYLAVGEGKSLYPLDVPW